MNNKIELLAPAGDLIRGKTALDFGADAIYFGAKQYSLRARASNFDFNQVNEMINYAHSKNKKAYLVSNVVCHNHMIKNFNDFIAKIMVNPPDAFLCADPAIILKMQKLNKPIHISTQQSVTNSKAALFFARNKATRIVTAREVSFNEIKKMIKNVNNKIEIEMFVHGAICIAYSGRCMLSSNLCLRDANNGGCAQSCRWVYNLYKDKKLINDKFSMSAKDMNLINYLKQIIKADVASIKIEGRMKSEHYIATVINSYRKTIDNIYKNNKLLSEYIKDVNTAANRDTSIGWFEGEPTSIQILKHENKNVNQLFALVVESKISDTQYLCISKNYFTINDMFQVLGKNLKHIETIRIKSILDSENKSLKIVHTPMMKLTITFNKKIDLLPGDIIRIKR